MQPFSKSALRSARQARHFDAVKIVQQRRLASLKSKHRRLSSAGAWKPQSGQTAEARAWLSTRPSAQGGEKKGGRIFDKLEAVLVPIAFVATLFAMWGTWKRNANKKSSQLWASTLPLDKVGQLSHNTSKDNLFDAYTEIADIVGKDAITTRQDELTRHTSSDWSSYPLKARDHPVFIAYPSTTEQVSEVVKVCHRRRIPIVAFSGGTSLEGQFANTCGGICLDLSRMDKILAINKGDHDAVVQPGVYYVALNAQLEKDNLFFPPDPAPGAMIGGMVGTGCSGTNSYRYGTMRDWVISLTVVLADGTVVKTRQRPRKSSAGYDLTRLFVGSEGTLGIVTEAVVKVTVKPATERVAVMAFDTYRDATSLVMKVVESGIQVAAVELMDDKSMKLLNEAEAAPVVLAEKPTVLLKVAGTEKGCQEQMAMVRDIANDHGARRIDVARNEEESKDLWAVRKAILMTLQGIKKNESDKALITDVAVPISKLADIVEVSMKDLEESGLVGSMVGHAGDGNFHFCIFYSDDQWPIAEEISRKMTERAIAMEGTVTGEHGVGISKREKIEQELGPDTINLMRQLKKAMDPLCILNCDKTVRMKP